MLMLLLLPIIVPQTQPTADLGVLLVPLCRPSCKIPVRAGAAGGEVLLGASVVALQAALRYHRLPPATQLRDWRGQKGLSDSIWMHFTRCATVNVRLCGTMLAPKFSGLYRPQS